MAPNFSPGFIYALLGIYLAVACAIAATIFFLGRLIGGLLPPVRHVAPLALAALAWQLVPVRDGRLTALWVLAGVVGAIDALLRDADRRYPPPSAARLPGAGPESK